MVTFAGFPLGGFAACCSSARSTASLAALGRRTDHRLFLGAAQAWGLGRRPAVRRRLDRRHRDRHDGRARRRRGGRRLRHQPQALVVQGAITGLVVGAAQALVLRSRLGRLALAWPPALAAIWAIGWAVTTLGRHRRSTSSSPSSAPFGAIAVTALTVVLPLRLNRSACTHPTTATRIEHSHEPAHRLRHRPDRPPRRRATRRTRPRRRRREPQRPRRHPRRRTSSPATPPTRPSPPGSAAGADVVYFCLNATNYDRWAEEFPPLQRGVLAGAQAAGARLVVLDNLYAYGPTGGRDLVETMQAQADLEQGRHPGRDDRRTARGAPGRPGRGGHRPRLGLLRPGATQSALGETVFGTALTGRTAQVMGNPDQPHSYSYTPDVAAALITLGTQPGATGEVWHLPVAPARSTRQIIDDVYGLAGNRPRSFAAGATTLRLFG